MDFKSFIIVLLLIIVGYLIFFNNGESDINTITLTKFKDNIKTSSFSTSFLENEDGDPLIEKCKVSLEECSKIVKQKYNVPITMLNYKKITNLEEAEKFFNIWKGRSQYPLRMYKTEGFPFVFIAVKGLHELNFYDSEPSAVVCNSHGELSGRTVERLLCG